MSEQLNLRLLTQDDTECLVGQLGAEIFNDAVLIGSSAIQAVLSDYGRFPNDVDLSVSDDTYRHLRSQSGWEESQLPDGRNRLRTGVFDVSAGWNAASHAELKRDGWQTASGLTVVGPSYAYAIKQERGVAVDEYDTAHMRESLLNPENPVLLPRVIERQAAMVRDSLPVRLQDNALTDKAVRLAATGMTIAHTLYGDPVVGRANQIVGSLERPEYGVAALYHNAFGLHHDISNLVGHLENISASDEDILLAVAAEAYADVVYGNGRRSDNPEAYDELLSAKLLAAHATQLGFAPEQIDRMYAAVASTSFDERTKTQAGKDHPDHIARAVTGVDLHVLSSPGSLEESLSLTLEDGMSARYSASRILGRAMAARGVRVSAVEAGLAFVDEYGDDQPVPGEATVMESFAKRVLGSGGFHNPDSPGGHKPPYDWTLNSPQLRREHARKHVEIGVALGQGALTATAAYAEAQQHTIRMREQFADA